MQLRRHVGAFIGSALALGPADNDHLSALRVGISIVVPSIMLLCWGHPELTIYAVFGAFTAMFGRSESHQLRLRHQLQAATVLVAGASIGMLLSVNHIPAWGVVATEAIFAGLFSIAADAADLKPAGPFFGIFALGACASVPMTVPLWTAESITIGSAACAVLVGFAGWVRSRQWQPGAVRAVPPLARSRTPAIGMQALRYIGAVGFAGLAGNLGGLGHAYWAMAAAATPLSATDVPGRLRRGIHRIVGTLIGLGVTALIMLLHPGTLVLAILVMVLAFPTELLMARHYGLALVFFTPLVLIVTLLADPSDPVRLIRDRGVETIIGAGVGIVVVILTRTPETQSPPTRVESRGLRRTRRHRSIE